MTSFKNHQLTYQQSSAEIEKSLDKASSLINEIEKVKPHWDVMYTVMSINRQALNEWQSLLSQYPEAIDTNRLNLLTKEVGVLDQLPYLRQAKRIVLKSYVLFYSLYVLWLLKMIIVTIVTTFVGGVKLILGIILGSFGFIWGIIQRVYEIIGGR